MCFEVIKLDAIDLSGMDFRCMVSDHHFHILSQYSDNLLRHFFVLAEKPSPSHRSFLAEVFVSLCGMRIFCARI